MTETFEVIKTDETGKVLSQETVQRPRLRVRSDEIIPKGYGIGTVAMIVDKMDIAMCDGQGNWYREADKPVAAGNPWSALFT